MNKTLSALTLALGLVSAASQATIVEFQTSHGNFKINLYDEGTPKTVENFLSYVTEGKYDNTIIHRTVDDFVIQGGGAKFEGALPPKWIETTGTIINEPVYSNVKATISMAKQGGKINSASSQWFINLKNNASVLDPVDPYGGGAYAVFGEVIEDGMDIVNAIAEVERCDTKLSGFRELPMPDYKDSCGDTSAVPGQENFVTVYNVVIYDSTVNTAAELSPTKNTLYKAVPDKPKSSGGGGSFTWATLLLCALPLAFRRFKK